MTGTQLAALVRRKTRAGTTNYSDAHMLVDVNVFIEEIAGRIQQQRPVVWNIPSTFNLVANQREYAFPADTLNSIVSLELKFTSSGDYTPAHAIKRAPSDFALQESNIVAHYNNSSPVYFSRRKALYILSGTITAVTDGGKLVYNAFPASLANLAGSTDLSVDPSTTTHGFPREFHELLARRVVIHYKDINGINLSREDLAYEQDLENALDNFSTINLDLQEIANMPSSASLSNHGFDL